jgi:hypothetical protein
MHPKSGPRKVTKRNYQSLVEGGNHSIKGDLRWGSILLNLGFLSGNSCVYTAFLSQSVTSEIAFQCSTPLASGMKRRHSHRVPFLPKSAEEYWQIRLRCKMEAVFPASHTPELIDAT